MKAYLKLQYNMLNRKIAETGLPPVLGFVLAIIGFYLLSYFLFTKTTFAAYFYSLLAIGYISKLSEKRRNDFLKMIFSRSKYKRLRIIENLIVAFPFLVFLLYKQSFLVASVLLGLSIILSIFNFDNGFSYTIPTPFGKKPFEFPVGFRKTFYFFPVAYFITFQSILVDNFNLGVASLLLIGIVVLSYYSKPENEYYVWSFSLSPKSFLITKIKTGLLYFTLLSLPVMVSLLLFFPKEAMILIAFLALSFVYIIAIILAKYAAYPHEVNIPDGMLIGISFVFPPLLLGIIPYFYKKSIHRLNLILEDD